MAADQFQQALQRLVTNEEYRQEVLRDERRLLSDFPLTPGELGLLQAVWEAVRGGAQQDTIKESALMLCAWQACCCCYWTEPG